MSEPKSITVSQRVKEYPGEAFTVSANKLFCSARREEVSIKKSVTIRKRKASSGAAEHVLSLLTLTFGSYQDMALQDYIESSIKLQFNKH